MGGEITHNIPIFSMVVLPLKNIMVKVQEKKIDDKYTQLWIPLFHSLFDFLSFLVILRWIAEEPLLLPYTHCFVATVDLWIAPFLYNLHYVSAFLAFKNRSNFRHFISPP